MAEIIKLTIKEDRERLDKSLSALLAEYTRSFLQKQIESGCVYINGALATKKCSVKAGDTVELHLPDPEPLGTQAEDIALDILYEDSDLLVVNKPKGMVVHPAAGNYSGTLVNALLAYCGDSLSGIGGVIRPGIVHRIDKDTSGLLIVAKNDFAHQRLAEMIKCHDFVRQYQAIVVGTPKEMSGAINAPIGRSRRDRKKMAINGESPRDAVTHYEVLEKLRGYSHIKLTLETGRTHQIRVHMAHIGHPVVCDAVYGSSKPQFSCCTGQCLHAFRIAFTHPRTGEFIDISAALPDYFTNILDTLHSQM